MQLSVWHLSKSGNGRQMPDKTTTFLRGVRKIDDERKEPPVDPTTLFLRGVREIPEPQSRKKGEEVEREERKSMPAAPYFAKRAKLMEEREKRHSDAKQALIAGLKLPAPPASEVQQAEPPAFGLDETWGLLKGISAKNWDTDDEEAKREGMADFSHEFFKVMVTPSLRKQFWKKVDASNFGDRLKFYRTLHDANEWAVEDKSPVIPNAARHWLNLKEEGLPTTGKGSRAALRMGTEITERMPKPKDTGFFRGPQARDFDPRVWLSETRKFASAVGRDIVEGAASLQVGPSGLRGTKTPGGEIGAFFKGEDPAAVQAQRSPLVTGAGGLLGDLGPELLASHPALLPAKLLPWLQASRLPVTEAVVGNKAYRATPAGQAYLKGLTQSTTLATAGGGLAFLEKGDPLEAVNSGLMWALFPVAHKAASHKAGDILHRLLPKRLKSDFGEAVVAETAGLGTVLAVMETQTLSHWLEADTQEEKDEIVGEALGRAFAFAAMGYGRVPLTGAKPPRGVPLEQAYPKDKALGQKAKERLQVERDINLLVEEIKGNPEAMKRIRDSLDKHWDAHEAVPRGAGVAEVVARMEALKDKVPPKVQREIDKMIEQVRLGKFRVPRPKPLEKDLPTPELKAEEPPTPVEAELHPEQKGWASESMSERFGNLGSAQRGKPEYAGIVTWKWRPEVSILGEAAEHIGDLTHRMTGAGKVGSGVAESFEKIRAWRRTLHNKFPEGSFEDHNYTHAIRMGAKKRGVSEKRFKSELDKELQGYADAHRKLKTYNDPQTWARDAAVALGERRWNDARRLMSKLNEIVDKGEFEWPMATLRDNVTNIPPPKELYSLAARIKELPEKTKREVEAVKEREWEAYTEGIERKEPFNEFEVAKRGEIKERRLVEEFFQLQRKWIRAMDEAKAPKPPAEGYLEPPATAFEAMKRDAAAEAADAIRAQAKPPAELPADIPPPELPADIPPSKPPPPDVGGLMGRPQLPRSGRMLPRSFSDAVISYYEQTGQNKRAFEFERDRDNIYEQLPVQEANRFIKEVTEAELETMAIEKETTLKQWENLIDAERVRRWEEKGDAESIARIDDLMEAKAIKGTELGQWIQQLSLFNTTPRATIKAINSSLKEQKRPKLKSEEASKIMELIRRTKKSNERLMDSLELLGQKPTEANYAAMVEKAFLFSERQGRQTEYMFNFLPEKSWAEILTTQIQGNLLTPQSIVLNIGAVATVKPIRMAQRFLDTSSDLLYAHTVGGGKDVLGRRVMIPNPLVGLGRSVKGMARASGVQYSGRVLEALRETRGKGLGLKPSKLARWREKDWKGFQTVLDVAIRGAETSPYELGGVALRPANSRLAMRQLGNLMYEDIIRYDSKPIKIFEKDTGIRIPGTFRHFNAGAKNLFEATFGIPPDFMFSSLYAGDVLIRKASEYRIFGNWAEQKLDEMGVTGKERANRIQFAMEDPRSLFTRAEIDYGAQLAAKEVYQGDNWVTDKTGAVVEDLRKNWPLAHLGTRVIVPYMKTPINVMGEVLSYTPGGGYANVGAKTVALTMESKKKGGNVKEAKNELKRATTALAVGLGVHQLANFLADYGLVQPHMPPGEEPEKTRRFARMNLPPGNVNVSGFGRMAPIWFKAQNDHLFGRITDEEFNQEKQKAADAAKWREGDIVNDLGRYSAGIILGVNVDAARRLESLPDEERSYLRNQILELQSDFGMATQFMMAQSYTQTMGEFARVVSNERGANADTLGSKLLETALTSMIPRTPSWFSMIREENIPTFRGDDFENMTRNKFQARFDSVYLDWVKLGKHRKDLPKILDMRGKEALKTPEGDLFVLGMKTTPLLWHIFGMGKVHRTSAAGDIPILDPTVMEMMRLSRKLKGKRDKPDTDVIASFPSPIINEKSEIFPNFPPYEMSPKQFEDFQKMVGEFRFKGIPREYIEEVNAGLPADRRMPIKATRGIDGYVADFGYFADNRTDEERARGIKSRLDYGLKVAKQIYLKQNRKNLKAIAPRVGKPFE